MKPKPEQTGIQTPAPWSFGGAGGFFERLYKAVRGSGAEEGENRYDPPVGGAAGEGGFGAIAVVGGDLSTAIANAVMPMALPRYRVMARHSTVALAEAANVLPILAAETNVNVDEDLADDPTAQRGKAIIEREVIARRQGILRGATQCLRYGFKAMEVVYERKTFAAIGSYVGVRKFKELAGDHVQLRVDTHGNLTQVLSYGRRLDVDYFLHFVHGKEDDNWFGLSRFENIRRDWANYLELEDLLHTFVRKGAAKAPYVGVMADDPVNVAQGLTPNKDMGVLIAQRLSRAEGVVYEKTRGLDALDMRVNEKLADANMVDVQFVDIGNPGPAIGAISARLDTLAKNIIRGMLLPERTLTEASSGGSRADSQEHGDVVTAGAEAWHEHLVEMLNEQVVAALIRENCGEEYVGRITLRAVPLQDERRKQLSDIFAKMLDNDTFLMSLIKSMGKGGITALVEKLGLDINLEDFVLDEPADTHEPQKPHEEDDDGQKLSASVTDEMFTLDEFAGLLPLSATDIEPRDENGRWIRVEGNELGHHDDIKSLRAAATAHAKAHLHGKTFTNDETRHDITLSSRGLTKILNNAASDPRRAVLTTAIPQLIKHGKLIKTEPPAKAKQQDANVVAYHRFQA
ncbi:MAG TPA: hypothetical protein VF595_17935, partial [Tepidisphaeraceae bacterium]